jgi:hypothetical protein
MYRPNAYFIGPGVLLPSDPFFDKVKRLQPEIVENMLQVYHSFAPSIGVSNDRRTPRLFAHRPQTPVHRKRSFR